MLLYLPSPLVPESGRKPSMAPGSFELSASQFGILQATSGAVLAWMRYQHVEDLGPVQHVLTISSFQLDCWFESILFCTTHSPLSVSAWMVAFLPCAALPVCSIWFGELDDGCCCCDGDDAGGGEEGFASVAVLFVGSRAWSSTCSFILGIRQSASTRVMTRRTRLEGRTRPRRDPRAQARGPEPS